MEKMKHFIIWVFLIVLSPLFLTKLIHAQSSVGVGLQIRDTSGPIINLIGPFNNSGNIHGNVTFFYNVSDASDIANCSLAINNKINMTNTSTVAEVPSMNFFEVAELAIGTYNWSINCTDSLGFVGEGPKNVFTVYVMTQFNGSTMNISAFDVRNITHFFVEVSTFGKINFSESIDLSHGFDLNTYINISFNKIELDSEILFSLNKSATLQLVGLTFSNPRIVYNGVVCPETICKKISYSKSDGVLTFNVSHWTSYEAEETPEEAAPTPSAPSSGTGGGGGGGGGTGPAIPISTEFTVDKSTLKVTLKQGQTKEETLTIKNTGNSIFDVNAIIQNIEKFKISPETSEIAATLQPNEEKTFKLVFKALENEKPDVYTGKIVFKGPSGKKEIDTLIEVDSAEPLFDVDVEVLPESKQVFPGDEMSLEVNLFNVRGFGRVDVVVEYSIKQFDGTVLAMEHETLAVETQSKFTRRILVPSDLKPGTYTIFAKVIYGDSVGVSSALFEVKARTIKLYPIQIKDYKTMLLLIGGVLLIGIIIFSAYRFGYLKKRAPKTQVEEVIQIQVEEKAQKLRKELSALEGAFKSGFISEESFKRDKQRIEDKLSKLK